MATKTDAKEKLNSLTEYFLYRPCRKQFGNLITPMKRAHFDLTKRPFGWLRTAAFQFCSFYATYLQQKTPKTNVRDMIE